MQRVLDRVREELHQKTVEGSAGGGVVTVELTADRQEVKKVTINPDVLAQSDVETVEDLVLTALRDGLRRAEQVANEETSKVTGGMNLPGLF